MPNRKYSETTSTMNTPHTSIRNAARTTAVLLLLAMSVLYLAYQAARVMDAISTWASLQALTKDYKEIDKALRVVNSEEVKAIPSIALTMLASVMAFRLVNLRMIPHQCFFCGRLVSAKKARQPHDKAFYCCEECGLKLGLGD